MASLLFVKKVRETEDVYTFYFEKTKNLKLLSGQYGLFVQSKLVRPHPFSLSSSPDEKYLAFTTTIREESRFKKNLMLMKPNEKLLMIGPMQTFGFVDGVESYTFIAQGIGIAPFRSLLKEKYDHTLPAKISLIHVSKKPHVFKEFTNQVAEQSYYLKDSNNFKDVLSKQLYSEYFYISGSREFIKSTKEFLINKGIPSSQIKGDSFIGYKY